jgi:hypothetical protein
MSAMKKMAKWISLLLVASCVLAATAPAITSAQSGAEDEYRLDLPGSGANSDTPDSSGSAVPDSSDSGGFPVLIVILVAAAAVAAGIAAWRLRKPGDPSKPDA